MAFILSFDEETTSPACSPFELAGIPCRRMGSEIKLGMEEEVEVEEVEVEEEEVEEEEAEGEEFECDVVTLSDSETEEEAVDPWEGSEVTALLSEWERAGEELLLRHDLRLPSVGVGVRGDDGGRDGLQAWTLRRTAVLVSWEEEGWVWRLGESLEVGGFVPPLPLPTSLCSPRLSGLLRELLLLVANAVSAGKAAIGGSGATPAHALLANRRRRQRRVSDLVQETVRRARRTGRELVPPAGERGASEVRRQTLKGAQLAASLPADHPAALRVLPALAELNFACQSVAFLLHSPAPAPSPLRSLEPLVRAYFQARASAAFQHLADAHHEAALPPSSSLTSASIRRSAPSSQ